MSEIYKTENFLIEYKPLNYNNNIVLELYRNKYYIKLQNKLDKLRIKYTNKLLKKNPNIDINDKNIYLTDGYSYDILSILIMNMDNKKDSIFNDKSPFDKNNLKKFIKDKSIHLNNTIIKTILKIYPLLSKKYIYYYYKLLKKNINKTYNIFYELDDKYVKIKLEIDIKNYKKELIIPNHIFNHLIKLYNIKNYNIYNDNDLIINNDILLCIYILFTRYKTISNGNNQASILPSFKKLIKDKLNIKVELFGSPLNTSYFTFGSYFYDTDNMFGSIGNFFNMNIIKGYYEINPPFDKCLINKIITNCLKFLEIAENNKEPLLFLFILPYSYFNNNKSKLLLFKNFLKFNILLDKNKFPYIRYSRDFKDTLVTPIVDTKLFICCTNYISNYTKININIFNNILNKWIKQNID